MAAKFEAFLVDAFDVEVRARFDVLPQRAEYIMGHIERGIQGVMVWAVPNAIRDRAKNLYGRTGFFARLDSVLDAATYERLGYAHKVRNRIAHAYGNAVAQYRGILGNLGVPAGSRKGLSAGRLLAEYPTGAAADNKWFHRFVGAYDAAVSGFNRSVRVS